MTHDVAIIGGGIVGLATALALVERDRRVVVLEAERELAMHQSGHNSGVIHAGLYYPPGSLKAQLCAEGREAMFRFCADYGLPHARTGKLVVAVDEREAARLGDLERRGRENGLDLERLDAAGILRYEPHVRGVAGLHVPETGVADFAAVTRAMAAVVVRRGGEVRRRCPVRAGRARSGAVELRTAGGLVIAGAAVNCAGLQCDRVARRCGAEAPVRIVPFRGRYARLVPAAAALVQGPVYPVPDPELPFLGVHFTPMTDGTVQIGPTASLALSRHGRFSLRDAASALAWPGTRRVLWQHRGDALRQARLVRRGALLEAARRLVPDLPDDALRPGRSGIRAQAVARDGRLVDDFLIVEQERFLHVLNAPSPAATASIAIGRSLAERVMRVT